MVTVQEMLKLTEAELTAKFNEKVKEVREGPPNPKTTNSDKLKVYGLYKQATKGDNNEAKPWAVQIESKAKWEAWTAEKGKSKNQAMAEYVVEIERQAVLLS